MATKRISELEDRSLETSQPVMQKERKVKKKKKNRILKNYGTIKRYVIGIPGREEITEHTNI